MATLTVLKFTTSDEASQIGNLLNDLQRQQLISVVDAAIVVWPLGIKKPRPRQLHNLASVGAVGGAFWGMLFGLIFFIPPLGMAIGAAIDALFGAFADMGINDKFIDETRSKVTEGSSALFLLMEKVELDKLAESINNKGIKCEYIAGAVSTKKQEEILRRTYVV
jgi:uncharacterized membrane protein